MSAEEIFWNWFVNYKDEIASALNNSESNHKIFDQLNEKLNEYDELLFGEVTGDENGDYVLILTCDGRGKGVYPLTKLAHFAPPINGWIIQQFRQPGRIFELNYRGLELLPSDFKIKYWIENKEQHIDVYITNYNEKDERFQTLAWLYLHHFVGEYEIMTQIDTYEFKRLNHPVLERTFISLEELRYKITDNIK